MRNRPGITPIMYAMQELRSIVLSTCGAKISAMRTNRGSYGAESFNWEGEDTGDFEFCGAGHFSAVFTLPGYPGYVIKVGIKNEDSGAMYAAWCRDNAGMPHIPEILHIHKFPDMYMVCMPKYRDSINIKWGVGGACMYSMFHDMLRVESATFPELRGTVDAILTFFTGVAEFDVHDGNYMADADGGIVITDPVSFTKSEP